MINRSGLLLFNPFILQFNKESSWLIDLEVYSIVLRPLERIIIPTGLKISLPKNLEAQIRPRSGLAYTHGISILNSPGTIDSDYRGEIKILLINLGQDKFVIEHGSRIAQLIIAPIIKAKLKVVLALNKTKRGHRGFGSTGQKA